MIGKIRQVAVQEIKYLARLLLGSVLVAALIIWILSAFRVHWRSALAPVSISFLLIIIGIYIQRIRGAIHARKIQVDANRRQEGLLLAHKRQEEIFRLAREARPWVNPHQPRNSAPIDPAPGTDEITPVEPLQTAIEAREDSLTIQPPLYPWKTLRVFISSTFRDMQAERDHLVRIVFPRLREELLPRRIRLVDVDLRWGITSDQNTVAACREVIDECHPRFIGMLGGRYGWVPEGQEQSITEEEIQYGVMERAAAARGHAFFYFRDDKATEAMVEISPGEFRELENSEAAQKLIALKQAIKNGGQSVFIYPASWDANQNRLTGLGEFGSQVYADLLTSLRTDPDLEDRFRAEADVWEAGKDVVRQGTQPARNSNALEFILEKQAMDDFIQDRTERIVIGSRQKVLDDVMSFITTDGSPNVYLIEGEAGSGKSSLVAKICQLAAIQELHLIHHFVGASVDSTDLRRTLRRVCHELWQLFAEPFEAAKVSRLAKFDRTAKARKDAAAKSSTTESNALEDSLRRERKIIEDEYAIPDEINGLIDVLSLWLSWIPHGERLVLIFDAVNQFDEAQSEYAMTWLPRELAPGVRVILSSADDRARVALRSRSQEVRWVALDRMSEGDTRAIIEAFLQRYSKRFTEEQIAALLAKAESGLPLYTLVALEELRTLGTHEDITRRIRQLPGQADALFTWILKERLSNDPDFRDETGNKCGPTLVEKCMSYLGISRNGLSQAELVGLIDPGDPLGNVAALLRLLRPYLMFRGELLDFFHGQLRQAVKDTYLCAEHARLNAHRDLANYFYSQRDADTQAAWKGAPANALSEVPYHQTNAEMWPELILTLESISFLEGKISRGMAIELLSDFSRALNRLPPEHPHKRILELLSTAIRRDIDFIALHHHDYPQALFQCLWNSAWWYDSPSASDYYETSPEASGLSFPWQNSSRELKISALLERWKGERDAFDPGFYWLRSVRPPVESLDSNQLVFRGRGSLSPDGSKLLTVSTDASQLWESAYTFHLWEIDSGRRVATVRPPKGREVVAYLPDGPRAAAAFQDGAIRIWDMETGAPLADLRNDEDRDVSDLAFSPDGARIVSGENGGLIRIWDVNSRREVLTYRAHTQEEKWNRRISEIVISPNGLWVLSRSGRQYRLWRIDNGREVSMLPKAAMPVFSHDSRFLLAFNRDDNTIGLWEIEKETQVSIFCGHEKWVNCAAFSADGRQIITGSDDQTVRLWEVGTGNQVRILRGHRDAVECVAFSPDARRALSGSNDGTVRLWDLEAGAEIASWKVSSKIYPYFSSVAFSPDSRRAISLVSGETRIWDLESTGVTSSLRGHEKQINRVAFSPDGSRIVTGSYDHTVRMWDSVTGLQSGIVGHCEGPVHEVAFSANGECVISYASPLSEHYKDSTEIKFDYLKYGIPGNRRLEWPVGPSTGIVQNAPGSQCVAAGQAPSWPSHREAADRYDPLVIWHASIEGAETVIRSRPDVEPELRFPGVFDNLHSRSRGRLWAGNTGAHLVVLRLEGGNVEKDAPFMQGYSGQLICRKCGELFNPSDNLTCYDTCHPMEPHSAFEVEPEGFSYTQSYMVHDYPCCNLQKKMTNPLHVRFPGCSLTSPYHTV